jgi:hypothetical protein
MSAEFFQQGESMTAQSNRVVTIPDYVPPSLYPAPEHRRIKVSTLTTEERKQREKAAKMAAAEARNALAFRQRQLKQWKKRPLNNRKAAAYFNEAYFRRLSELLGR